MIYPDWVNLFADFNNLNTVWCQIIFNFEKWFLFDTIADLYIVILHEKDQPVLFQTKILIFQDSF